MSSLILEHNFIRLPGRLRPDFLARCKYDAILEACTG